MVNNTSLRYPCLIIATIYILYELFYFKSLLNYYCVSFTSILIRLQELAIERLPGLETATNLELHCGRGGLHVCLAEVCTFVWLVN